MLFWSTRQTSMPRMPGPINPLPRRYCEKRLTLPFTAAVRTINTLESCLSAWNKDVALAYLSVRGVVKSPAKSAPANLPLAARPCVGHIRLTGDVAEWLKAAVC
jgi:hypothetical protein